MTIEKQGIKEADEIEKNKEIRKSNDKKTLENKASNEVGGRGGLDPSRFGDWEIAGKCVDF